MTSEPLHNGSISLRLYPCPGTASEQVNDLRSEATLAQKVGYDGVMVSEHHAGFPGYLPNPLQLAAFLLAASSDIWVAPCPLLLPLKAKALVAEEIAWLSSAYPERLGVGFAAGALPVDFEVAEVPFEEINARFKAALPWIINALRGSLEGPLSNDLAIQRCLTSPLPMVIAAQSQQACIRAAKYDCGVLFDSLQAPHVSRNLSQKYREAGGSGPVILIRRVWIGDPPVAEIDAQMRHYHSYASRRAKANWSPGDSTVVAKNGEQAANQLLEILRESECDTVNVRVHVAGLESKQIQEQIQAHEENFLPILKNEISDLS
ncbi:MAG TPA: LLM class flavin-dependent oxidoreductase [Acidimicrobiales bacterium]|nr:LLM class flavin-dependent oxidoreductase [Acidimicrobiales bacterium]